MALTVLRTVIGVLGFVLVVHGVGSIYGPAAWIVAGAILLLESERG